MHATPQYEMNVVGRCAVAAKHCIGFRYLTRCCSNMEGTLLIWRTLNTLWWSNSICNNVTKCRGVSYIKGLRKKVEESIQSLSWKSLAIRKCFFFNPFACQSNLDAITVLRIYFLEMHFAGRTQSGFVLCDLIQNHAGTLELSAPLSSQIWEVLQQFCTQTDTGWCKLFANHRHLRRGGADVIALRK